jgi:membrane-associated phospholipid phosphatase
MEVRTVATSTPLEAFVAPAIPPSGVGPTLWRFRWVIAWAVALILFVVLVGFPGSRAQIFVVVGLGLVASGSASPSGTRWKGLLVDWLPFYALLTLYDMLRGSAGSLLMPHVIPQIRIDEWLFGGTAPTVALQHWLYTPGVAHPWDYAVFGVYMTHFVVPFIVAGVLWKYAHARFRRFAWLFLLLTFAALVTYALYPAVPPWLASKDGFLPPTAKIIDEMWTHVRLSNGSGIFSATGHFADPVAAVPSLHSAYPMLLVLFFWRSAGRWRWLLALYPLAMGFALVYTAEHFVIDVLLGWLYAGVVFVVGNRLYDSFEQRRAARSSPALAARDDAALA